MRDALRSAAARRCCNRLASAKHSRQGVRTADPRSARRSLLAGTAVLAGCAGERDAEGSGKLVIATTVAPITSIVSVGGDRVDGHRHRPRGHELAHLRATAERGRDPRRRPTSSSSTASQLEEPTKELAEENKGGDAPSSSSAAPSIAAERLDLRLLVPGGRRQAQPPPLDQPADSERYAEVSPRRPVAARPRRRAVLRRQLPSVRRRRRRARRGDAHLVRHDPAARSCSPTTTPTPTSRRTTAGA